MSVAFNVERYRRERFAALPRFKSPSEVAALRTRAGEVVDAFDVSAAGIFTTRDQAQKSDAYFLEPGDKIRHAMHDLDPVFDAFSRDARIAQIADAIGIAQPLLYQPMYIFKQPRIGEVRRHQDASFFHTEPLTVTAFWLALEDATRENGCLWGGTHTPCTFVRSELHRHVKVCVTKDGRKAGRRGLVFLAQLAGVPYIAEEVQCLNGSQAFAVGFSRSQLLSSFLPSLSHARRSPTPQRRPLPAARSTRSLARNVTVRICRGNPGRL